ncbi:MAG: helix-turn-helix transcriptional regulator [Kiritimatiellae bacterium]|nr:helix-turn-helix transcriptional regulator [Kiritimatiellia bacterium]
MTDAECLSGLLDRKPELVHIHRPIHGVPAVLPVFVPDLWAAILYEYEASVRIEESDFPIRPGFASIIPPGVHRVFRFSGRSVHRVANFDMPRRWRGRLVRPVMVDTREQFLRLRDAFDAALGLLATHPRRAEVKVWDMLLTLAECPLVHGGARPALHPALRRAVSVVESWLSQPFGVAQVAREAGISHNQLIRLFQKEFACTVVAYVRRRRMQLARHWLIHSDLPLKVIAARVGIPDPHLFNKTVRRQFGCAPSDLRRRAARRAVQP